MDYKKLKEIINKHDPVGLLKMGAPQDEYDPEIKSIFPRIKNNSDEEEIRKIVHEEFTRWFGEGILKGNEKAIKHIVKDITQE